MGASNQQYNILLYLKAMRGRIDLHGRITKSTKCNRGYQTAFIKLQLAV